jgi:hypothetical protein
LLTTKKQRNLGEMGGGGKNIKMPFNSLLIDVAFDKEHRSVFFDFSNTILDIPTA